MSDTQKLSTLFEMYNIKCVISVDDCYGRLSREKIEPVVKAAMASSIEPFHEFLSGCGHEKKYSNITWAVENGAEPNPIINDLVNQLNDDELEQCLSLCGDENAKTACTDKNGITTFLGALEKKGIINEYKLIPTPIEAIGLLSTLDTERDEAILWLLDRDFSEIGYSTDAGFDLAKNIFSSDVKTNSFVYFISAKGPDEHLDDAELEIKCDELLNSTLLDDTQLAYFIPKRKIMEGDPDKLAQAFAKGFKRRTCFSLMEEMRECMECSIEKAKASIKSIKQDTLTYLFEYQVKEKGESFTEFASRLVRLIYSEEYYKGLSEKYPKIREKANQFENLCAVIGDNLGDTRTEKDAALVFFNLELYNMHVNEHHLPITTGDIFKIGEDYYILASQACDVFLREGKRSIVEAILLKIVENGSKESSFQLPVFKDNTKKSVQFRPAFYYPFEILDLCVLNKEGKSELVLDETHSFEEAVKLANADVKRMSDIRESITGIVQQKKVCTDYFNKKTSDDELKNALEYLDRINPLMKEFSLSEEKITYPVKRVARLEVSYCFALLQKYAAYCSRIPHDFDFTK